MSQRFQLLSTNVEADIDQNVTSETAPTNETNETPVDANVQQTGSAPANVTDNASSLDSNSQISANELFVNGKV